MSTLWETATIVKNGVTYYLRDQKARELLKDVADAKVDRAGDTMTGSLHIEQASGDTYLYAKRTDTSVQAAMGVGIGGTNHGIYSWGYNDGSYHSDNKWMIYRNSAGSVIVNGHSTDDFNLQQGTSIPNNSDLNDYTTPGTYYCANATVAATLSNIPNGVAAGFKLVVYYKGGVGNINQELYPNGGENFYIRYNQSGSWYGWKRVIDTGDLPLSVANGGTGATTATAACANLKAFDLGVNAANAIASGDNLDNYKTVGTYFCATNAIAQNLTSCPTTRAFKMIVMYSISSAYLLQIIYDYRGEAMWQRWYNSTWSPWYKYSSDVTSSDTVNTTYGGVTQTGGCVVKKIGNVVQCEISHGNGTAFSGLTGIDSICTIPSGYRPTATIILPIVARDNGTWASANYVTAILRVTSAGAAEIRYNKNVMGTMKYITGTVTWQTSG